MKLMPVHIAPLHHHLQQQNASRSDSPPVQSASPPSSAGGSLTSNSNNVEHHTLPMFGHQAEFMWRYGPLAFPSVQPAYTVPAIDFKNRLPNSLTCDPRLWNKEDVISFLHWCELEFDLPRFDTDLFQMNGKALYLLTKQDLGERCPGAGDLIYNVLRWLIRDQHHLPQSPVTPHFPLAPSWCVPIAASTTSAPDYSSALANSVNGMPTPAHNSVTLSPAPSVDSQSGSPKSLEQSSASAFSLLSAAYRNGVPSAGSSGSNHSDSEGDDVTELNSPGPVPLTSTSPPYSPRSFSKTPTSTTNTNGGQIFFPPCNDTTNSAVTSSESNTNGRLLWDFLQQLLNDSLQRYNNYITWKNRESGVFKIVDPPGLAKLWGIQKNHLSMNYDKMSRALRYYYRVNILRKVQGERHCYQFLRNPTELKSIKNISLLRQQSASLNSVKTEPLDDQVMVDEDGPTDLSMNQNSAKARRSPISPARNNKVHSSSKENKHHQFPQDLTISQLAMEARENFCRQLENRMNSKTCNSNQITITLENSS